MVERYDVTFADIRDLGQAVVSDFRDLSYGAMFNCITLDGPYLYGYEGSTDKREDDYGGYAQSREELISFIADSSLKLPKMLRPGGKIMIKCSDQYNVKTRKFDPLHYLWHDFYGHIEGLVPVDFNVFPHHHMSGLAFQVKDRPMSVIMHTYFMWYQREGGK